jgi:predicted dehydrogenase
MTLAVGLIGFGYWGPNLARNVQHHPEMNLVAICDRDPAKLAQAALQYPQAELVADPEQMFVDARIQAVVIAVPVRFHYPLALRAISMGKHVLLEKPMTASVIEAEALCTAAARAGVVLMVDHTFILSGAVQRVRSLIDQGEVGQLTYYDATRINLGLFQSDADVLWDLGPHDLSILDYLFDSQEPIHIVATGHCHVNPGVPDMAFITLHYSGNRIAHLRLSWMSPVKIRQTLIAGEKKMVVWNDLASDDKIRIYDKGISVSTQDQPLDQKRQLILPEYRVGDVWAPRLISTEPLELVINHFWHSCNGNSAAPLDAEAGLRNVRLLENISVALQANLMRDQSPPQKVTHFSE